MSTYEAITIALNSNLVLIGVITVIVMLIVANKKS